MRRVLALAPLDLVDLLLDLEGLEVVEFGLVGLEFGVKLVFAGFFLGLLACANPRWRWSKTNGLVSLEEYDSSALVSGREVVSSVVELDGRDDVGWYC